MKIDRTSAGLLVLRLGAGLALAILFGWPKLADGWAFFAHGTPWPFVSFNRAMGLPAPVVVACVQTVNESVVALLVAAGLFARPAATCLAIGFATATACSLHAHEPAWMMAGLYAVVFAALALIGPGALSADEAWRRKRARDGA